MASSSYGIATKLWVLSEVVSNWVTDYTQTIRHLSYENLKMKYITMYRSNVQVCKCGKKQQSNDKREWKNKAGKQEVDRSIMKSRAKNRWRA